MYNENNLINQLSRNPCIRFFNKKIEVLKDQNTVGNRTWGKLDYLVTLGYSIDRVSKFTDNYTYEERENFKNKKFKQWKKRKIIYDAVVNNTTISGKFGGSTYNVCDLMDLNPTTLDALYVNINKTLSALSTGSLISKNRQYLQIENQKELVETVFNIVTEKQKEIEKRQKELEQKRRKVQLLKEVRNIKEVEDISKLSLEELDKKIEELE